MVLFFLGSGALGTTCGSICSTTELERALTELRDRPTGKGTLARLNSTDTERAAREAKLAAAVRTLLECIGEDPDRDGLIKTPERYAKALLWMTKGYEERLPGASYFTF